MRIGFRARVPAPVGLAALALAAATAWGATQVLNRAIRAGFVERVRAETGVLADWARETGVDDPHVFAARAAARVGARVTLIGAGGRVLGDSARSPEATARMENHLERPEVRAARLRGSGESLRTSATTHVTYLYSARRIPGDLAVRFVRVALPVQQLREVAAPYRPLIWAATLAAFLAPWLGAYVAHRVANRSLSRLRRVADRVAGGETAARFPLAGGREIDDLARGLHRMKRSLVRRLDKLGDEHYRLASVVSDMREGLLLVGPDKRIRLANPAARRAIGIGFDPVGHLVGEAVRQPAVIEAVERALSGEEPTVEGVLSPAGPGRSFEVRAAPVGRDLGVLVLLFDITRLLALENVRREFVADVSHELRTPLTSIRAFVETLQGGAADDRKAADRFLGIVAKHAERMEALIDDLTELSRIETGAVTLRPETVDAAALAREIVEAQRPLAERKQVRVRIELPSPFPLRADRRRLEQVLANLIVNGIKFNRPGGELRVHGARDDSGPSLVVEDDGIGIPGASLERIFHRFYRVDPARSRDEGGTGLGLAIVKHLVRLHGGRVRAESELGVGSRFVVEFPPD